MCAKHVIGAPLSGLSPGSGVTVLAGLQAGRPAESPLVFHPPRLPAAVRQAVRS